MNGPSGPITGASSQGARPGGNHNHGSRYPEVYLPAFNAEFSHSAPEEGSAFVPWTGESLDEILCEHYERIVGNDNCVSFEGRILQIPSEGYRLHYVRATVRIHRHPDGSLSLFHGPRKLSDYPSTGIRQVEALL